MTMKLPAFVTVLLPLVSAFVNPGVPPSIRGSPRVRPLHSTALGELGASPSTPPPVSLLTSLWQEVVHPIPSESDVEAGIEPKASDVHGQLPEDKEKLRRRNIARQERRRLEGQLYSLLHIVGDTKSPKVEAHVRRISSELEALQANANDFGKAGFSLAGRWRLMYSSAGSRKRSDAQGSVEDICYVSENYRISHADNGALRVYRRVQAPRGLREDDTARADFATAHLRSHGAQREVAGATAATAQGRLVRKPLHKRRLFGWLR